MFTTSLPQLLSLLEIAGQAGVLTCFPLSNANESAWQATCQLHEGKITACQIHRTADGGVLREGWPALAWLKAQGGIYWQLKESSSDMHSYQHTIPLREAPAPNVPGAFPCEKAHPFSATGPSPVPLRTSRTYPGRQGILLETWPREHRTVFLLIDGTRSKADILRLLPVSFEPTIDTILADLGAAGVIEY